MFKIVQQEFLNQQSVTIFIHLKFSKRVLYAGKKIFLEQEVDKHWNAFVSVNDSCIKKQVFFAPQVVYDIWYS